ncbi:hypothetical protein M5X05_05610 [Paenibacillus alvei]|uniref:hypothetical protein n=1 Tax=Paenibacillus alvei TaxID=44250 RepID=UPI002283980C|nr:hypothetical protein [Paenibacillus alvei]MCY9703695.1 hypothetical protein [Paenibacillus alvei]
MTGPVRNEGRVQRAECHRLQASAAEPLQNLSLSGQHKRLDVKLNGCLRYRRSSRMVSDV